MKTTSLELSKQLKEAGAKQESEKIHAMVATRSKVKVKEFPDGKIVFGDKEALLNNDLLIIQDSWSSFDCYELLERLPAQIGGQVSTRFDGNYYQLTTVAIGDGRHEVGYKPYLGGAWWHWTCGPVTEHLGKLYLWCLENGHIE